MVFESKKQDSTDRAAVSNSVTLDEDGVIRLSYRGAQTRDTLRQLTSRLLRLMAERRQAGKEVLVLSDMRGVTGSDSSARLEAKWFLEEADYDVLAIVGNRYLQPLMFFVLRDYKRDRTVKYFADEKAAHRWLLDPGRDTRLGTLKLTNKIKWAIYPLVLLLLVATFFSWQQARHRLDAEATRQLEVEMQKDVDALQGRLHAYTDALYGFRGLFHASEEVSEQEFHDYFTSLDLNQNYPGFNSINYVAYVKDTDKESFLATIRANDADFFITPENNRADHYITAFVGVEGAGSNKGVDQAANEERRTTLESARDSGLPTATDTILLLNEAGEEQPDRKGFLITIPIYKSSVPASSSERRMELQGFVNAVFDYEKLFNQTFASIQASGIGVQVLDDSNTPLYTLQAKGDTARRKVVAIDVAGQSWKLEVDAPEHFGISRAEAAVPSYVLTLGISLVIFLVIFAWLQNRGRQRALDLAGDMTEDIKQERNAAIATRNKDEAILSSIGDGVLVLDTTGRIVLFNAAAEVITGFSTSEAIGKPYKDILHFFNAKDGSPTDEFVTDAMSGKRGEMARNTMLRRKDGSDIPVADSAAPVVNGKGEIAGAVLVFRDVTQERQLEQMKDELLSVASHELRTPMGAIRANVSMILAGDYGPVNQDLVEPLTDMKASTIRLVNLVNDLLSVARLDAGRTKFTVTDFDIRPVLEETVASLAPLCKERKIDISLHVQDSVIVQADSDKIKQILTNLIGNALKFTDEGGGIAVSCTRQTEQVEVAVRDTGVGISAQDQQKLFGKFQQITSVQDGKPAGTGLGLYISREIVRKIGGDLWIKHSEAGKGSTFAFTLPLPGTPKADQAKRVLEQEALQHPDQR